ncbi:MAG: ferrous iron transporter B, partial [Clostridia bacterium]|nr:ferrous iron transporter B [Clostridia bacterium]
GSALAGMSFMIFNLLCAPCFAAMGAIKREMNSPRFTAFAITYMCVFAYAASFVIYRVGVLFTQPLTAMNVVGGVISAAIVGVLIYLLARKNPNADEI